MWPLVWPPGRMRPSGYPSLQWQTNEGNYVAILWVAFSLANPPGAKEMNDDRWKYLRD
jgi:hypothetical protein